MYSLKEKNPLISVGNVPGYIKATKFHTSGNQKRKHPCEHHQHLEGIRPNDSFHTALKRAKSRDKQGFGQTSHLLREYETI